MIIYGTLSVRPSVRPSWNLLMSHASMSLGQPWMILLLSRHHVDWDRCMNMFVSNRIMEKLFSSWPCWFYYKAFKWYSINNYNLEYDFRGGFCFLFFVFCSCFCFVYVFVIVFVFVFVFVFLYFFFSLFIFLYFLF